MNPTNYQFLRDPVILSRVLWPKVRYYKKQLEIIYSVWHNKLTICVAGNMLGKDFVAGRIALMFYLTRTPCHVVTTSVDHTQLESVLWGEIRTAIQESKQPLLSKDGGPLLYNHLHIRKVWTYGALKGQIEGSSYLLGRQARHGEGMLGHHVAETGDEIPRTLFIGDEASGLDDLSIDRAETWADRMLLIGNPYPCANRFFKESEAGDLISTRKVKYWEGITLLEDKDKAKPIHYDPNETAVARDKRMKEAAPKTDVGKESKEEKEKKVKRVAHYLRKVIQISCEDSPNVRLGKLQERDKVEVTNEILIPGVMSYWKFKERELMWDDVKKCIQLYGRFYKGAELLLFPPHWLNKSEQLVEGLRRKRRIAKAIGCDPGEGAAESCWYVIDDYGILDELALRTPNTTDVYKNTLYLMRKWQVDADNVMMDAGGGGHEHADYLREAGHAIHTVAFGESVVPKPKRGMTTIEKVRHDREAKYAYVFRRDQMFGHLSTLLEPLVDMSEGQGYLEEYPTAANRWSEIDGTPAIEVDSRDAVPRFCIPPQYRELRRQLSLFPKVLDGEGRMKLPPKSRKASSTSKEPTLIDIIGCSPDRADALAIAVYCRDFGIKRPRAGAAS